MHKLGIHIEKILSISNRLSAAPIHMRDRIENELVGAAKELAQADSTAPPTARLASGERAEIERAIATKQELLQMEKDGRKAHEIVMSIRGLKAKLPAESFSSGDR